MAKRRRAPKNTKKNTTHKKPHIKPITIDSESETDESNDNQICQHATKKQKKRKTLNQEKEN